MKLQFFIGLRYLKTRKANSFISRISIIGVCIVALAIMIPMVTMSVMNGYQESLKSKHINKDFHVKIYKSRLNGSEELINKIKKIPELKNKISNITLFYGDDNPSIRDGFALVKYKDSKYFKILMRGAEPNFYIKDNSFNKHFPIISGNINLNKKFRIIIGDKLVKFLNPNEKDYIRFVENIKTGVEETISVLIFKKTNLDDAMEDFDTKKNIISIFKLRVSGIFKSGYSEYDQYLSFMSLDTAQTIFKPNIIGNKDRIKPLTGVGIKLHNRNDSDYVENIINKKFENKYLYIKTWKSSNSNLLQAFDFEKNLMSIVLAIMIVATVIITIYVNLNIVVMDKKREIGILKSFGVKNNMINSIFIIEGFLIGLIGAILGIMLSILIIISLVDIIECIEDLVNKIIYYINPIIKQQVTAKWSFFSGGLEHLRSSLYIINYFDLFWLSSLAIFVSMLAAYFPARKSTQENITGVIRYE
ncbi:MAG: FtsX-like permease family protein [Spirochaetota bacterium]|nr:FtsX-like permease family protein [Spirochaetota bacterium]